MGSGKLISRAIRKYGLENFKKEILHIFSNELDMNAKEKELVVVSEQTYNLCPGGKGGFGYINSQGLNWSSEKNSKISGFKKFTPEQRKEYSKKGKISLRNLDKGLNSTSFRQKYPHSPFYQKNHSDNAKDKIRRSLKGKIYIHNSSTKKRISPDKLEEFLLNGWLLGYGKRGE